MHLHPGALTGTGDAELVGIDVELAVAEAVDPPHLARDGAVVTYFGQRHQSRHQRGRIDRRAELRQGNARRQVASRGGEDVTAREGRAGRREVVVGVVERHHRTGAAGHRHRRGQQPVVGPQQHAAGHFDAHQAPARADTGVDHREHDAVVGEVLHRAHEEQRAGAHVVRRDVVADVEDSDIGREPRHHGLAHADEFVSQAVVGRERDEHAATLSARAAGPAARPPGAAVTSAGLGVAVAEVGVDVDVAHPERPSDAHCGQFARFDDAIDRHGRYSHEIGDFLHCQESRRGE